VVSNPVAYYDNFVSAFKAGHQSSETSFDEQDTVFNGCTNLALLK
jgi:hypothetical protein